MSGLLWTVVAILLILWLAGQVTGAIGSFIHLLLVVAAVVVVLNLLTGRTRV